MENRRPRSYTFEDIKRYRQGLMTREEMHAFEKASMEDPFLSDALEGYMEADMQQAETHLEEISEKIRGEKDEEKGRVVAMPKRNAGFWRVAAMVIVIAGAGLLTYQLFDKDTTTTPGGDIAKVEEPATRPTPGTTQPEPLAGPEVTPPANDRPASPEVKAGDRSPAETSGKRKEDLSATTTTDKPAAQVIPPSQIEADQEAVALQEKQAALARKAETRDETRKAAAAPTKANTESGAAFDGYRSQEKNVNYTNEFRGRVLSPANEPLANANVRVENTRQTVTTDAQGNFSMNASDSVVVATVESKGYIDTRVKLRSNTENTINVGNIVLQRDPSFDNIAVTGLGTSKKKVADTLSTRPEGGWESFQQYVAGKLNIAVDTNLAHQGNRGELELEFYIDANGLPRDFKVISSSNTTTAITQQAIEAVKQGPRWETRKRKTRLLIRY